MTVVTVTAKKESLDTVVGIGFSRKDENSPLFIAEIDEYSIFKMTPLRVGLIVLKINGQDMIWSHPQEAVNLIRMAKAGRELSITVEGFVVNLTTSHLRDDSFNTGISLKNVNNDIVISRINDDSIFANTDLKRGMKILSINTITVNTVEMAMDLILLLGWLQRRKLKIVAVGTYQKNKKGRTLLESKRRTVPRWEEDKDSFPSTTNIINVDILAANDQDVPTCSSNKKKTTEQQSHDYEIIDLCDHEETSSMSFEVQKELLLENQQKDPTNTTTTTSTTSINVTTNTPIDDTAKEMVINGDDHHYEMDTSTLYSDDNNFAFFDRICSSLFNDQQTLLTSAYHSKLPTMKNNFKRRKIDRKLQQKNLKQEKKRSMMSQDDLFVAATASTTTTTTTTKKHKRTAKKKRGEIEESDDTENQKQQQQPRVRLHTPKFLNKRRMPKVGPSHWKRLGPD